MLAWVAIGSVVWTILKVLLWIIAGIFIFALLVVFVPFQYRIRQSGKAVGKGFLALKDIASACYRDTEDASTDNRETALPVTVTVSWLFGIIGVVVKKKRREKDFRIYLRLLWIPIRIKKLKQFKRRKKGEREAKSGIKTNIFTRKRVKNTKVSPIHMLAPGDVEIKEYTVTNGNAAAFSDASEPSDKTEKSDESEKSEKSEKSSDTSKRSVWRFLGKILACAIGLNLKITAFFETLKIWVLKITSGFIKILGKILSYIYTIIKTYDKIDDVSQMVLYYTNLIRSDEFAAFVDIIKKELRFILHNIAPKKFRVEIGLGNTDSYELARAQICLSMLKPFMKKKLIVFFNPNEDYLREKISVSGSIQVFTGLHAFLWYLRHKAYMNEMLTRFKYTF